VDPILEADSTYNPTCPLTDYHKRDRFAFLEKQKRKGANKSECLLCHKKFRTEAYLERHMETKHATPYEFCLADF
jgi:hypothetical protein